RPAHHRMETRDRRLQRCELPPEGTRPHVLPGAVLRPHGDRHPRFRRRHGLPRRPHPRPVSRSLAMTHSHPSDTFAPDTSVSDSHASADLAARARQLDADDPLAAFRDAFEPASEVLSYLDGNSL